MTKDKNEKNILMSGMASITRGRQEEQLEYANMTQNSGLPKEFLEHINRIVEENADDETKIPRPNSNDDQEPGVTSQFLFKRSFYDYEDASANGNYNNSSLTNQPS